MAARMYKRGNIIYWLKGKWSELEDDICTRCHHAPTKEGHDYCLRDLGNNIAAACCGHGDDSQAYILLKDGRRFVLDTLNLGY